MMFSTEVFLRVSKSYKFYALSGLAVIVALIGLRLTSRPLLEGLSFSSEVYARDGELLRLSLSGDEKYRLFTKLDEINQDYINSVLLLEDRFFYFHPGINPYSLAKAALFFRGSSNTPGASTITMQLVRLRYGVKTRHVHGKLRQIFLAIYMELTHSKKEILEAYLNLVPLGGPVEGIGGGSRIFFNKAPKDLIISESLLLAVIPQSPSERGITKPSGEQNISLTQAKDRLLKRWLKDHPGDIDKIFEMSLPLLSKKIQELPFLAPHFTEMVLKNSVKKTTRSTLDLRVQKLVEEKTRRYVQSKNHIGINNASVLVVNHETHEVISYLGSSDFFNKEIEGQVNGLLAKRSPGSALKPFVYALAFQQGIIHPKTLLKDTPTSFALYDPENFDQKFLGPVSAEQALILSRNIPAINLSQQLKNPNFYDFLKKAHIYFPHQPDYYGLSLVLGGTEVSSWEIAHLYSALANRGEWSSIKWDKSEPASESENILSAESAFMTLDILTKAPRPNESFKKQWVQSYYPVAWKTGTSHAFKDAWTVGVVGPYTIVVWLGNFNNISNQAFIGRDLAAPLFFQIIDGLNHKDFETPQWQSPIGLDIKPIAVCEVTGALPADHCPHQVNTWFHPGVSPISRCDLHRPVLVSQRTGLRSCTGPSDSTELKVYEFWPSDLQALYNQAGIRRKLPPSFEGACSMNETESLGLAPKITSPVNNVTYLKSLSLKDELNTLTFEAVADSDVSELFWFIDQEFIGKTKNNNPLHYKSSLVGDHVVTVVDNMGRSDSKKIELQAIN